MDLVEPNTVKTNQTTGQEAKTNLNEEFSIFDEMGGLFTGGHINASAGVQYSDKNFGRDSAISMLFLLDALKHTRNPRNQREVRYIIEQSAKSLVHWQGQKPEKFGDRWRRNSEEPGKIHHEAGPVEIDTIGLADKWQEEDDKSSHMLVYFGSVDSTPLFVKLVCEYTAVLKSQDTSGHSAYSFLLSRVFNFRGVHLTVVESLLAAAAWITKELESSELGFIEYQRRPGQEEGLTNQTWKDSLTSYVHADGQLVNTNQPVASIEVQALAYDALAGIAELFTRDKILASSANVHDQQIEQWEQTAKTLQKNILERFWIGDEGRFAMAIDRLPGSSQTRQVKTPSSNELHLLNSRVFDDLPAIERQKFVEVLVRAAAGEEFLTDVGIRCRAASQAHLIDFADYHGSWAIWPWDSHWIALGLRRQGFIKLADELDKRILNSFALAGDYLEYFLADPKTGQAYHRFTTLPWDKESEITPGAILASTLPDTPQTWSVTAAIDIKAIMSSAIDTNKPEDAWCSSLEEELLVKVPKRALLTDAAEIHRLRESSAPALIDRVRGRAADLRYHDLAGTPAPVLLPTV